MFKNIIVKIIIISVIVGGLSFFSGMKYQQSQQSQSQNLRRQFGSVTGTGNNGFGQGQQGLRFGGLNSRPITGEVIATDEKTVTVKLIDGGSKIILFSDKTEVNKTEKGSMTDLKTGVRVAAFGKENTDGTITAESIQLNPVFGGRITISPPETK